MSKEINPSNVTLGEATEAKKILERDIHNLILDYEKLTGLSVGSISVVHNRIMGTRQERLEEVIVTVAF